MVVVEEWVSIWVDRVVGVSVGIVMLLCGDDAFDVGGRDGGWETDMVVVVVVGADCVGKMSARLRVAEGCMHLKDRFMDPCNVKVKSKDSNRETTINEE